MNKYWNRILNLSKTETGDISKRFVKLQEEVGEFAASYLEEDGFKIGKTKKTPEELRNHILEEGVDAIIMVLDILANKGFTIEEIESKLGIKLDVWEKVLIDKGLIST